MRFDLTDEQKQLKQDIRDYFEEKITPELLEEIKTIQNGPYAKGFIAQMGKDGWLGVGWPKKYGGQGKTGMEQYIFFEELNRTGAPFPVITIETVGPTLMKIGSEKQKNEILPRILEGSIDIAIGYSEPEAGTDLAAVKTTAVKDGDEYVINGQKVFTTNAHHADYIWLAARTDPDAPKHKGISIFLMPTDVEGFSWTSMNLMGSGASSNTTYYDNVRIPASALVGEENKGWEYITSQLSLERLMLSTYSVLERNVQEMIEWSRSSEIDGVRVIDNEWVRLHFADILVDLEALKILNLRAAWGHDNSSELPFRPSMNKVFAAELNARAYNKMAQILGNFGQVQEGVNFTPIQGKIEKASKRSIVNLFGGGANDVQRDLTARFGLGLPRFKAK